jgi:hypothetical protein
MIPLTRQQAIQSVAKMVKAGLIKVQPPVDVTLAFERRVKREERERRAAGK